MKFFTILWAVVVVQGLERWPTNLEVMGSTHALS